jgi:hypothetical protein
VRPSFQHPAQCIPIRIWRRDLVEGPDDTLNNARHSGDGITPEYAENPRRWNRQRIRILRGVADPGLRGQMDDAIRDIFAKNVFDLTTVGQVGLYEMKVVPCCQRFFARAVSGLAPWPADTHALTARLRLCYRCQPRRMCFCFVPAWFAR